MAKHLVSPSPHVHASTSTRSIMLDVILALLPAVAVSVVFYGLAELLILAVSVASCVAIEWAVTKWMLKKPSTVGDLSAVVTGILLAMNVPATCPWWIIVIGAIVAIGVVKMTFGGLGQNVFNPAITARIFLLISFPQQMTSWALPKGGFIAVDGYTGATPLGVIKEGLGSGASVSDLMTQHGYSYADMLFANIGGSAGELSAIALLVGFAYLLLRKVIKPWTTLSIFAAVAVFSGICWGIDPAKFTDPVFNLLTGGMILGACFMATDYVTSPMSTKGQVVYGIGVGVLVMLIRYFGAYPEGMSFAILIMNMTVPLLNRWFHQTKYGRK